ncbi:MAG: hypothetical protein A2Z24_00415 [Candidatus Woykebacteria bacterium RBG_16_44_10]|uniref:Uncharacterized protein n=1 Tax=Candidatus Woykebacteria bacterium RBG_16_44_10 TaxID=1802597 RepID=A0A1G1WDP1_9BACT|nr:MAG: hypothetical protein A2Z24_00415 [Candidatus Woykebacteria bacterium RBG_16_44_10]
MSEKSEPKKINWKNVLIGAAIGAILVGLGVLIYLLLQPKPEKPAVRPTPKTTTSAGDKKNPSQFQQILTKNCQSINQNDKDQAGQEYKIDPISLPIRIDFSKITFDKEEFNCDSFNQLGEKFVVARYDNNNTLYIFDDQSQELTGGPPFHIAFWGEEIKTSQDVGVKIYLTKFMEPGWAKPGVFSVYARARKSIKLSNGETVHVSTDRELMPGDDQRLINFEQQNPQFEYEAHQQEVHSNLDKAVKNYFFSDMSRLGSPEKENLEYLERILEAFDPKD